MADRLCAIYFVSHRFYMIREIIEVEVSNIDVDTRYYSFDYLIKRNDKIVKDSSYSNDHSWDNDFENFQKLLEKSLAVELALEQLPLMLPNGLAMCSADLK